jgi:hypothetical protein
VWIFLSLWLMSTPYFVSTSDISHDIWCPKANCAETPSNCELKLLLIAMSNKNISREIASIFNNIESPLKVAGENSIATASGIVAAKIKKFSGKVLDSFVHDKIDNDGFATTLRGTLEYFLTVGLNTSLSRGIIHVLSEPKLGRIERYDVLRHFVPCTRMVLLDDSPYLNGNVQRFFKGHFILKSKILGVDQLNELLTWVGLGFEKCQLIASLTTSTTAAAAPAGHQHYLLSGPRCPYL